MTKTYRELTGKEKDKSKSWLSPSVPTTTRYTAACRWTVSAICSGYATHAVGCAVIFARLYCRKIKSCKPYLSRCPLPSVRNAASTFRRTVNVPTVPTSVPHMQDASKQRQECESTENKSGNKTLCNELASEMP